jgi:hypothetical protein
MPSDIAGRRTSMKIFLCYASEDRTVAEKIQLALASANCTVFFDEQSLPAGGDYHDRIRKAIERCDLFIFLITSTSVAPGKFTLTELKFARDKWPSPVGKVLPVNLEGLPPSAIPSYLSATTILSVHGNAPSEVRDAVEVLLENKARTKKRILKAAVASVVLALTISIGLVQIRSLQVAPSLNDAPPNIQPPQPKTLASDVYVHPSGSFERQGEIWVEYPSYKPGHNFRFKEARRDDQFIYLYDETRHKENDPVRVFYLRLPVSGGMAEWSYPNPFQWQPLYPVTPKAR